MDRRPLVLVGCMLLACSTPLRDAPPEGASQRDAPHGGAAPQRDELEQPGESTQPAPAPLATPRAEPPALLTPFDGRTLAGWEGDPRFWRVEEGTIVGESTVENPCERTTYLVWRGGTVGDFELTLAWRIRGGNSGVQFRSRAASPFEVAGYQADIEAGPDWTGGLYEQDGRAVVARRGERVVLDAGGARQAERFAPAEVLLERVAPDGWNELRLVAFGPRITIEVNGEIFSEVLDLDPARAAREGSLALQLHAGPPMRIEFRDLHLRVLAEPPLHRSVAPTTTSTAGAADPSWDVAGAPQWIWPAEEVADGQVAWFRKRFELPAEPARAEIWATCDNHFEAWINEEPAAWGDDWMRPMRREVSAAVHAGENELLVRGENESSAAALALALWIDLGEGREVLVTSDPSWSAAVGEAGTASTGGHEVPETGWGPARSFGGLDADPWRSVREMLGEVAPGSGQALDGSEIAVPPGFEVELVYPVPLDSQGSWVSLAVDPAGRLYAGDQYGGIFRIEPAAPGTPRETRETRVTPLELPLGEAHGLLWAFDSLYAVVSGAGGYRSGLHRARDTDGDGELDEVTLLREFEGDGEHGPHAVLAHPDGRSLVVVGGNHTLPPGPFDESRLPPHWDEDVLLPPIPDPGGHAVGIRAPGGWIVRTDPEGKSWELFAAGFRNTYDAAFDPQGELFTYDADMEWDVGLPWYRPTRVLHVVSGGEYGWRSGSAKWPPDYYDSLPPAVELELGSPTGIVFGDSTGFPPPWKHALFVLDWAYGRIFAVFLEPEGASYRGRYELFAAGAPFPVTDAVVGPEGALYVTTGGRRTQSGLYRISWTGEGSPGGTQIVSAASENLAGVAHRLAGVPALTEWARLRRSHEEGHHAVDELHAAQGLQFALGNLGHPDRFVRSAARVVLEHRDHVLWSGSALSSRDPRRALEGMLALVHVDRDLDPAAVLERAAGIFERESARELRLDALRLLQLALLRLSAPEQLRAWLRERLDPAYPTGDPRLDRELLGLLVDLQADVSSRALDALERAPTQEERIAILYALRALRAGWTEEGERRFLAGLRDEIEGVQGGASARGYVERIEEEACESLGVDLERLRAERAEEPVASTAPDLGGLGGEAGRSAPWRPSRAWTLAELEPALSRIAWGRSFDRGRSAYLRASCHTCHRMDGEGESQGPDLTGAAGRYSPRDLLLALLEPSREVPDVWRDTELWGEDRLLAAGRIEAEDGAGIRVREASGACVVVPGELVLERWPHPLSRMPEGLLDPLEQEEILDLLAYVLAGGRPADERFTAR